MKHCVKDILRTVRADLRERHEKSFSRFASGVINHPAVFTQTQITKIKTAVH